jgi:hypothetical protein
VLYFYHPNRFDRQKTKALNHPNQPKKREKLKTSSIIGINSKQETKLVFESMRALTRMDHGWVYISLLITPGKQRYHPPSVSVGGSCCRVGSTPQ